MATRASGTVDVALNPLAPHDPALAAAIGRLSIDKQFHGDLEASSKGEMLAAGTAIEGSAGYVALEQVVGTLNGRAGSFALQHTGIMTRGAQQLAITVVPDSGTGELVGLAGTLAIIIEDGKHLYEFDYTIAEDL